MEGRYTRPGNERRPTHSRLRNPLNVVVEKVGATRAMVHGDVSIESLKELLTSSLSLLPGVKSASRGKLVEEKRVLTLGEVGEGRGDPHDVSGTGKGGSGRRVPEESSTANGDVERKAVGRDFLAEIATARASKSKPGMGEKQIRESSGGSRTAGSKHSPRSEEYERGGRKDGEKEGEQLSEIIGSLPSCSSITGRGGEALPLSCDGRWMREHFKEPLVHALRDIAMKKPQDPVEYLGFWLRNYRSVEEKMRRQSEIEKDLKNRRISPIPLSDSVHVEYREPEFSESEEGGGNADQNFRNYHPSTPAD